MAKEDASSEIKVIGICVRNLESLPPESRARVLAYLRSYFAADRAPTPDEEPGLFGPGEGDGR